MVWEFITTFVLMFTICGVTTYHRGVSYNLPWIVLAIASLISLFLCTTTTVPITGARMNPARSLGPAIVSGDYKNIWVYIISPTLGAVTTSTLYKFLQVTKPAKPEP
ncbi:hypothetical protein CR513_54239, partial [Mucuna pruriens]